MTAQAPNQPGEIIRPGELQLGDTTARVREVSQHPAGDASLCRRHREGDDIAAMKTIQRILVAVDFSKHADQALEAAVELTKQFGAELHLVHALDVRVSLMTPYEAVIRAAFVEDARDAAASKLDVLVQKLATGGVRASVHLTEDPAASAIVDLAEKIGADLIVMGTRGHTGLTHVLLGSVAERTLRHAPCSVLTVK